MKYTDEPKLGKMHELIWDEFSRKDEQAGMVKVRWAREDLSTKPRSLARVVCEKGGSDVFEITSREPRDSLANWVDNMRSLSLL